MEQLDRRSVEFRLPSREGDILEGTGEFWVRQNPEGLLAMDIAVDTEVTPAKRWLQRFPLSQVSVDAIERHPNPAAADFQLVV